MTELPVEQLLYTNAPGEDGRGFRLVRRPEDWSEAEVRTAESWLRSLEPGGTSGGTASEERGFAFNCLRGGSRLHAVLALLDGAFARDAYGRGGGVLAHLLAVPVDEGQDPHHHALALVRLALGLRRPDAPEAERLGAYLVDTAVLGPAIVHPPRLAALRELGAGLPTFLRAAAEALDAATPDGRALAPVEVALPALPGRPLVQWVAAACGALPPRLRLALRWGCGLRPKGYPPQLTLVVRMHRDEPADPGAEPYGRWLAERLVEGEIAPVRELLTNWNVRSWQDLLHAIEARPPEEVEG